MSLEECESGIAFDVAASQFLGVSEMSNTPKCPKCGSPTRPMKSGKGFQCELGKWNPRAGRVEGCDGCVWNKSNFSRKEKTARASDWPGNLSKFPRTAEQNELRSFLSQSPSQRGSRLLIVDAVAGSAKSWSMGDCAEVIWRRVGNVIDWYICAFNTNARDSLEEKIPAQWLNISTINGFGGRLQGYSVRNYKPGKIASLFSERIKGLPKDERPKMGPLKSFAERCRDMLAYSDNPNDQKHWQECISRLCCRFPGLSKKLDKKETGEVIRDYLPALLVQSLADNKVIDLTEQYARPAMEAIKRTNWSIRWECLERGHNWTDDDVNHFAALVRSMSVPALSGVIVDEAQDLSPSQVALFLAATWKKGELILVGDDKHGSAGDKDYKAGQGIFSWRGAGGGWLSLIPRIWKVLTGEGAAYKTLSVTFRVPQSGVDYIRAFCPRMTTARKEIGQVLENISAEQAYSLWLDLPEGKRALWLSRRNAPLGPIFMQTLKDRKKVALRGGGDFSSKIDGVLFECAGWYNDAGEYSVSLRDALAAMRSEAANEAEETAATGDDSLAGFVLSVGEAILSDPSILREAKDTDGNALQPVATVGNLKRFVTYFASADAPRVLSTIYRAKGDEADLVVLDDLEAINQEWNGDTEERNAVAFVAGTRHKETLAVIGSLAGPMGSGDGSDEDEPINPAPVVPVVKEEKKASKPRKSAKQVKPLSLFDEE